MNDVAILERARLGFVGVADEIDGFLFVGLDEAPFHAAGKPGAAAPAQAGGFHLVHDLHARHLDRGFQLLVTAVAQVAIDVGRPVGAADVLEDEAMLEGVGWGLVIGDQ